MRISVRALAIVASALVISTFAVADSIQSNTGLTGPGVTTITFDENGTYPTNTAITTQFTGASFTGFLWNNTDIGQGTTSVGFTGANLISEFFGPSFMTITFATTVNAAVFAALDQNKDYLIQAYLGTTLVDSMPLTISSNPGAGFIGFSNENFDTITITGPQQQLPVTFAMDTLEYIPGAIDPGATDPGSIDPGSPSAVPEPSSIVFVGTGLVFLSGLLRKHAGKR